MYLHRNCGPSAYEGSKVVDTLPSWRAEDRARPGAGGVPEKVGAEGGKCPRDAQQGNVTGGGKGLYEPTELRTVPATAIPDEQRLLILEGQANQ